LWLAGISRQRLAKLREVLLAAVQNRNPPPARWIRQDLQYLAFPPGFGEPPAARSALGRVAMGVMRDFAGRLPGFAQSSLTHLRANFLDISASVQSESGRRVVRLARPPLDIVLNMTGMSRASYRIPWLHNKQLVLFPESAV
jgi:hypothetical protein